MIAPLSVLLKRSAHDVKPGRMSSLLHRCFYLLH